MPDQKVLVVDNNPLSKEYIASWPSIFVDHGGVEFRKQVHQQVWSNYWPFVKAEREFLKAQENVILIPSPEGCKDYSYHGSCLDVACRWCDEHKYDYMILTDPDVLLRGSIWFEELCNSVDDNTWAVANPTAPYFEHQFGMVLLPVIINVRRAVEYMDKYNWTFDPVVPKDVSGNLLHNQWDKRRLKLPQEGLTLVKHYDTAGWFCRIWEQMGHTKFIGREPILWQTQRFHDHIHFCAGTYGRSLHSGYGGFTHERRNCPLITHL